MGPENRTTRLSFRGHAILPTRRSSDDRAPKESRPSARHSRAQPGGNRAGLAGRLARSPPSLRLGRLACSAQRIAHGFERSFDDRQCLVDQYLDLRIALGVSLEFRRQLALGYEIDKALAMLRR